MLKKFLQKYKKPTYPRPTALIFSICMPKFAQSAGKTPHFRPPSHRQKQNDRPYRGRKENSPADDNPLLPEARKECLSVPRMRRPIPVCLRATGAVSAQAYRQTHLPEMSHTLLPSRDEGKNQGRHAVGRSANAPHPSSRSTQTL